jgi:hypothetical protein
LENLSEEETILNFPSGNYSVTGFWINLERKVMSHFLQIFLPSGSFVMVSWISFLMPLDAGERAGKVFQSTYFFLGFWGSSKPKKNKNKKDKQSGYFVII